jgi:hypothetical protein
MKSALRALLGLLLLAAPQAGQAQFYYSENPNVGFTNNTITLTITGYYGPDGAVSIPTTIGGWAVTGIGEDAFYECIGVTNITIPASVTSIGASAFSDSGLTSVTIPGNVTNIGPEAFADCASLTNAILDNGVTSIGASAFSNCPLLVVTIPASVISIGPFAFSTCESITNVTISNGVISIGDDAFYYCTGLPSVTIPPSVTTIGEGAFNFCVRLTAITVDAQNSFYSSVDGVLFDKNVTTLVEAPSTLGGSYTIPLGVASIGNYAFSFCDNLTNVTIPNGVTSIGADAFYLCNSMTSVAIPASVTRIGAYAFYNCGGLTSVTFPGNVTSIGEDAFFACIKLTSVYFGGDPPAADSTVFIGDNSPGPGVTVYYLPGTTGWGSTFAGQPTALWRLPSPVILNNGPNFGVQNNTFGFTISWATNTSFVVEASANLAGPVWTPLQTNTLTNGSFYFSEPLQTNSSGRFYRIRSP